MCNVKPASLQTWRSSVLNLPPFLQTIGKFLDPWNVAWVGKSYPSAALRYPLPKVHFESMIFLLPFWWDTTLVLWRVSPSKWHTLRSNWLGQLDPKQVVKNGGGPRPDDFSWESKTKNRLPKQSQPPSPEVRQALKRPYCSEIYAGLATTATSGELVWVGPAKWLSLSYDYHLSFLVDSCIQMNFRWMCIITVFQLQTVDVSLQALQIVSDNLPMSRWECSSLMQCVWMVRISLKGCKILVVLGTNSKPNGF